MNCHNCIYSCYTNKNKEDSIYVGFMNGYYTYKSIVKIFSCGKSTGYPIEIPENRIVCSEFKIKNEQ
jgi:hypothetical protein